MGFFVFGHRFKKNILPFQCLFLLVQIHLLVAVGTACVQGDIRRMVLSGDTKAPAFWVSLLKQQVPRTAQRLSETNSYLYPGPPRPLRLRGPRARRELHSTD